MITSEVQVFVYSWTILDFRKVTIIHLSKFGTNIKGAAHPG